MNNCSIIQNGLSMKPTRPILAHSGNSELSFLNSSVGGDSQNFETWSQSQQAKASLASILSALYAMILIILCLAFEVSGLVSNEVHSSTYNLYYVYLYTVGLIFFAFCQGFLLSNFKWTVALPFDINGRKIVRSPFEQSAPMISQPSLKRKATHSAKIAGSFYLRFGAILFGIVGVIEKALQIYRLIDLGPLRECDDYISILEDVTAIIFIFVQLYFVFQNSKMTIHRFKEIAKLGSMHLIATNICIWIRALVVEEYHLVNEISHSMMYRTIKPSNVTDVYSNQMSSSHPMNSTKSTVCLSMRRELGEFVKPAKQFMTTCLIEYALICAAVMYVLWRNIGQQEHHKSKFRKQNFQIDCSSSTNGLFIGLAFVVFTLVSMAIFYAKVQVEKNIEALWVFYFSDCLLYSVSIVALVMGVYKMRNLCYIPYKPGGVLLDDILLYVGLVGQCMFCIFSVLALTKIQLTSAMIVVVSLCRLVEVLLQTVFILFAQRLVALSQRMQTEKPGRELITFLLLSNVAMFLINIFEAQKAGANPLTLEFYGESTWTVIVHSTVPLSTFYRFHSSVCFAEIWKKTYRFKEVTLSFDNF